MKEFLSRLFGSSKQPPSQLQSFLGAIGPEKIMIAYCTTSVHKELRLPSGISMNALHASHQMVSGIIGMISELKVEPTTRLTPSSYDAAAFEATAYCHAWLRYSGENGPKIVDPEDNDEREESPYEQALSLACSVSSGLVCGKMVPPLPKEAVYNRSIGYGFHLMTKGIEKAANELEWKLKYALCHGKPQNEANAMPNLDLPIDLAVKTGIGISHQTTLPAMVEVSRNLLNHGQEILDEWNKKR